MAPKKVKEEPIEEGFSDDCFDLHAEFSGMNRNIKDEDIEETFLRILQGDSESRAEMEMGANGSEDESVSLFTQNKDEKDVPILDDMNLPGTSGIDPNEDYRRMMWNLETQETEKLNIKVKQNIDWRGRENQPKLDLNADFITKGMQETIYGSTLRKNFSKRKD
ncbi:unnamed protein product, partial [Mesorhabditis belari]|uniref:Uncharacterized protein n=1 Tax=Mesorhabditis belari TaxID=2138241 RepID=A0AAF3J383_9BILA